MTPVQKSRRYTSFGNRGFPIGGITLAWRRQNLKQILCRGFGREERSEAVSKRGERGGPQFKAEGRPATKENLTRQSRGWSVVSRPWSAAVVEKGAYEIR